MRVRWLELSLHGFGLYRDRVTVRLSDGVNTLVAPNERGKSTLVAGLAAVLFGLPVNSKPEEFGHARYRNWQGSNRFEGAVEFEAAPDGAAVAWTRYRIERNFEDHRIRLLRWDGKGWAEEVTGSHNPGAQKRNERYEVRLKEILGVTSRELFEATFCVVQPMPRARELDQKVQGLLSGAGGGHFQAALTYLENQLKRITKYSKGVTKGNAKNDGELERTEAERRELESRIRDSQQALDSLEVIQEDLERARKARDEAARVLEGKEALLRAWDQWQVARERWRSALKNQSQTQLAYENAHKLTDEVESLRRSLERELGEFRRAPAGSGDRLEDLDTMEKQIRALEDQLADLSFKANAAAEARGRIAREIEGEYRDFVGRPDLLRDHRDLVERVSKLADLLGQLGDLASREKRGQATLAELPDYGKLVGLSAAGTPMIGISAMGTPATGSLAAFIKTLKVRALDARRGWERFTEELRRAAEIDPELSGRYALLEGASPELTDLLKGYDACRERLNHQAGEARREVEATRGSLAAFAAEEREFLAAFADLEGIDELVIDRKVRLLGEEGRLSAEVKRVADEAAARRKPALRAAVAAGAFLVAGLVAAWALSGFGPGPAAVAGILAGVLAGGIGWVLGRGLTQNADLEARAAQLAADLDGLRSRIRETDAELGPLAGVSPVRLGEVRQRLQAREAERCRLEAKKGGLPAQGTITEIEARYERALSEKREFEEATAGAAEKFGDVRGAYEHWQELRREREILEEKLRRYAAAEFDADAPGTKPGDGILRKIDRELNRWYDAFEAGTVAPSSLRGNWLPLAALAWLLAPGGARPPTGGELYDWITTREGDFWETVESQARAWEGAAKDLDEVRVRREWLLAADSAGRTAVDRLEQEIEGIRDSIRPFDERTSKEDLELKVKACRKLEAEALELEQKSRSQAEERERLERRLSDLRHKCAEERELLSAILEPADGDVATARTRYRRWRERGDEIGRLENELTGLLRGQKSNSIEELNQRLLEASNASLLAQGEIRRLAGAYPGLPSPEEAGEVAGLNEKYALLKAEVDRLYRERDAADSKVRRLLEDQSRLQGQSPLNVAQAELDLKELNLRKERLEVDAEALALAHRELKAAVEEFQASHREWLAEAATRHFASLTGVNGRRVLVDEGFRISVREPEGVESSPAQLSQGAQDQLYLALRLAIADLLAQDVRLPFIFDDPFLNCDQERLDRIRGALESLAPERQVLLLSHREELADWGARVEAR